MRKDLIKFLDWDWKWIHSILEDWYMEWFDYKGCIYNFSDSLKLNIKNIIGDFDISLQKKYINNVKNISNFDDFILIYKQILSKIKYGSEWFEFYRYWVAYSKWKSFMTNNTTYSDKLWNYYFKMIESLENYFETWKESYMFERYYRYTVKSWKINKENLPDFKNAFRERTVIDLWCWEITSEMEQLSNKWWAKQYIWIDIYSTNIWKSYKEWKIPVHKFKDDMFNFFELAENSLKNEPKIFIWNWLTLIREYYNEYLKHLDKVLNVWDNILFSTDENMSLPTPTILPYSEIEVEASSMNRIILLNTLSYEDFFNKTKSGIIDENNYYFSYFTSEDTHIKWKGWVDNPNYISMEDIISSIPEKLSILEKINKLDIIKKIWWFEKFSRNEWLELVKIIKDNKIINSIYLLLSNNFYFRFKKDFNKLSFVKYEFFDILDNSDFINLLVEEYDNIMANFNFFYWKINDIKHIKYIIKMNEILEEPKWKETKDDVISEELGDNDEEEPLDRKKTIDYSKLLKNVDGLLWNPKINFLDKIDLYVLFNNLDFINDNKKFNILDRIYISNEWFACNEEYKTALFKILNDNILRSRLIELINSEINILEISLYDLFYIVNSEVLIKNVLSLWKDFKFLLENNFLLSNDLLTNYSLEELSNLIEYRKLGFTKRDFLNYDKIYFNYYNNETAKIILSLLESWLFENFNATKIEDFVNLETKIQNESLDYILKNFWGELVY